MKSENSSFTGEKVENFAEFIFVDLGEIYVVNREDPLRL